jgi:hypothetical protein
MPARGLGGSRQSGFSQTHASAADGGNDGFPCDGRACTIAQRLHWNWKSMGRVADEGTAAVLEMTSKSIRKAIAAIEAAERLAVEMDGLVELRERLRKMEADASAALDVKSKTPRPRKTMMVCKRE